MCITYQDFSYILFHQSMMKAIADIKSPRCFESCNTHLQQHQYSKTTIDADTTDIRLVTL